ncbi:regulatory particle non-ATPase 13 isoform X2 [Brevipalpus obovatus]|uniref:regulatory particle non-ATPase 13 isoform X2 n=1 Tax=Brevipalpus obovatus TaxID=246614 RepID=UPI003D9DE593
MSSPFLFGTEASPVASKYLVEFKAGKMNVNGTTVAPIKRKGTIYLNQSDDNLMHFCWKDRQTGVLEEDLILFPDDAEFKKVPQCTTGRVYVLKFKSSSKRCFYWMQEPNEDKDEDFCKKINEYLSNPPAPGMRSSGNSGGHALSGLGNLGSLAELGSLRDSEFQSLLSNMNPQQLMQMIGTMQGGSSQFSMSSFRPRQPASSSRLSSSTSRPTDSDRPSDSENANSSSTTSTNSTTSAPTPRIQLGDLQSIISGLTVPKSEQQPDKDDTKLLSSITKSEALQTLLSNEQFMRGVRERLPPTEAGEGSSSSPTADTRVSEQLSSTLQSPQFQQALNKFGLALQSGQLGPLLHQFGLSQACVEAADKGGLGFH